jgi:hypothetical protein
MTSPDSSNDSHPPESSGGSRVAHSISGDLPIGLSTTRRKRICQASRPLTNPTRPVIRGDGPPGVYRFGSNQSHQPGRVGRCAEWSAGKRLMRKRRASQNSDSLTSVSVAERLAQQPGRLGRLEPRKSVMPARSAAAFCSAENLHCPAALDEFRTHCGLPALSSSWISRQDSCWNFVK